MPSLATGLLLIGPALAVLIVGCLAPRVLVGDGHEYVALYLAWLKTGRPWLSGPAYAAYDVLRASGSLSELKTVDFMLTSAPYLALGNGTHDVNHFWMYSGLAAILGRLCPPGLCADPTLPFLALHAVLALLVTWVGFATFGRRGIAVVGLLLVVSPTLWFAGRIHTEYFTAALTVAAVFCILVRRHPGAILMLALASTQNPSFGIPAVVTGLAWLTDRRQPALKRDAIMVAAAALIAALHPAYYWFRFGGVTPQLFGIGARADLGDVVRLAPVWFLDPDIGLFPNWPLGLVLMGLGLASRRSSGARGLERVGAAAWICLGSILIANLVANGFGDNINSGGTVHVARYGTWYLCLFVPFALAWTYALPRMPRRSAALGLGAVVALALLSAWQYRPWLPEVTKEPTRLSLLIQTYLPGLYDPPPEVFAERYSGREPLDIAAVVGPDCRKVAFHRPSPSGAGPVASPTCQDRLFDPSALAREVAESTAREDRHGWAVDRLSAEAASRAQARWTGHVRMAGTELPPAILAAGWSDPESWGAWSDGTSARLILPLARPDYPAGLRLTLGVNAFVPAGPQRVRISVGSVGEWRDLGPADHDITIEVAASSLDDGKPLVVAFELPGATSPRVHGLAQDDRRLALALTVIDVAPLP